MSGIYYKYLPSQNSGGGMGDLYGAVYITGAFNTSRGDTVYMPQIDLAVKVKDGYVIIGSIWGYGQSFLARYSGCTRLNETGAIVLKFCGHTIRITADSEFGRGTVNVDGKFSNISYDYPFFFKL